MHCGCNFVNITLPITAQYSNEKMQLFYGDGGLGSVKFRGGTCFMVTHRLNVVVLGNSTFYEFVVVLQNSNFFFLVV